MKAIRLAYYYYVSLAVLAVVMTVGFAGMASEARRMAPPHKVADLVLAGKYDDRAGVAAGAALLFVIWLVGLYAGRRLGRLRSATAACAYLAITTAATIPISYVVYTWWRDTFLMVP